MYIKREKQTSNQLIIGLTFAFLFRMADVSSQHEIRLFKQINVISV